MLHFTKAAAVYARATPAPMLIQLKYATIAFMSANSTGSGLPFIERRKPPLNVHLAAVCALDCGDTAAADVDPRNVAWPVGIWPSLRISIAVWATFAAQDTSVPRIAQAITDFATRT
jgi:hypothetical protein